jgi:hypothetical protein
VRTHVRGYLAALDRLRAAGEDGDLAYHAIFEALNWAVTIQDYLGGDVDPDLNAIRVVRNRVHHKCASALEWRNPSPPAPPGVAIWAPATVLGGFPWHWRPLENLPDPDPGFESPAGHEAGYRQQFAGRPVWGALDALAAKFKPLLDE